MVDYICSEIDAKLSISGDEDNFVPIPLREAIHATTIDTIGKAGAGVDFGALENHDCEVNALYASFLSGGAIRHILTILSAAIPAKLLYSLPISHNKAVQDLGHRFRILARSVVKQRKERKLRNSVQDEQDVLGVVIDGQAFTDEGLEDQVMTMIAAGIDGTAVAVSWALLTLCQNHDLASRLREEVRQNLPSPTHSNEEEKITADKIEGLPYLMAFCNEVNRFFPGVPMTTRVAIRDTVIGGQAIPKGTTVVISSAAINTDTRFWGPDAHDFNPDRFLKPGQANSGGATTPFANLSFLQGGSHCLPFGFNCRTIIN